MRETASYHKVRRPHGNLCGPSDTPRRRFDVRKRRRTLLTSLLPGRRPPYKTDQLNRAAARVLLRPPIVGMFAQGGAGSSSAHRAPMVKWRRSFRMSGTPRESS